MINHIDEGIWILRKIGASENAQRAYALHPLVQDDAALSEFASGSMESVDKYVLMLAMEYRWVANSYLSFHPSRALLDIKLSPLQEVNQMLIADKIQNRKDFERYHQNHPNCARLKQYFSEWLARLSVSEGMYQQYVKEIVESTAGDRQPLAQKQPDS